VRPAEGSRVDRGTPVRAPPDRAASSELTGEGGREVRRSQTSCPASGRKVRDRPTSCPASGRKVRDRPTSCPASGREVRDRPTSCPASGREVRDRRTSCPDTPQVPRASRQAPRAPNRLNAVEDQRYPRQRPRGVGRASDLFGAGGGERDSRASPKTKGLEYRTGTTCSVL
jgi:hypothetical protein